MTTKQVTQLIKSEGISFYKLGDYKITLSKYQKSFDGNTLGMFLSPYIASDEVSVPTIVVREDATKWTVVHEYMHYLLNLQKQHIAVLNDLTDAREDYLESYGKFKNAGMKFVNAEQKSVMIKVFLDLTEVEKSIWTAYPLEEMAIEDYLGSLFANKLMVGADEVSSHDAKVYIRKCYVSTSNQILWTLEHYKTILGALDPVTDSALISQLKSEQSSLEELLLEANAVYSRNLN